MQAFPFSILIDHKWAGGILLSFLGSSTVKLAQNLFTDVTKATSRAGAALITKIAFGVNGKKYYTLKLPPRNSLFLLPLIHFSYKVIEFFCVSNPK